MRPISPNIIAKFITKRVQVPTLVGTQYKTSKCFKVLNRNLKSKCFYFFQSSKQTLLDYTKLLVFFKCNSLFVSCSLQQIQYQNKHILALKEMHWLGLFRPKKCVVINERPKQKQLMENTNIYVQRYRIFMLVVVDKNH